MQKYPAPKDKIHRIWHPFTKQEHTTQSEEKNPSIETDPEMIHRKKISKQKTEDHCYYRREFLMFRIQRAGESC